MMTDLRLCYVTAPSFEEAKQLGRQIVAEKLAACVNIIEGMTSIYRWKDAIEEASEAVLLVKTRLDLMPKLTERIKALHPYDLPCILEISISGGEAEYLEWLKRMGAAP